MDAKLLLALQEDATLTSRQLAELVHLSVSATHARVKALRETGAISGFHAHVCLPAIGRPVEAMIAVRIRPHSRKLVEAFREYVMGLPETMAAFHVAGTDDFLVHVALSSTEDLRNFVLDDLAVRPEIGSLHTSLVYQHHRKAVLEVL